MSILKFLLSPLLNEHGYTTLPTAQTASGKPVTTVIFANIKAALDGFNDGTGIGNGAINIRHTSELIQVSSDWGMIANSTTLPTGWVAAVNNASDVTYSDTAAGEPAIYLFPTTSNQAPVVVYNARFANATTNGAYYFYARIRVNAIAGSTDLYKVGWNNTSTLIGGNTDNISVYLGTDSNLYLRVRKASVNYDTLLQAYALNIIYNIRIEWLCGASISVYINKVLKTTYTTTANFPTAILIPFVGSNQQIGGQVSGLYVSATNFGKLSV